MLSQRLRHYFYPKTLEQTLGLFYLIMAISMIERPYLAGVENLSIYYGLTQLAPRFVGALLALFGGVLIWKKRCGRKLFALLFVPIIPVYFVCLALYFADRPLVGLAGTLGYAGLMLCLIELYKVRAAQRERGAL